METFDYQSQFESMKKDTVEALTKALALESKQTGRAIRVNKVWVDDDKDSSDFESQRQATRADKTWGVPVYAAMDLVDTKTGKVLSKTSGIKIATLPKGTDLGSFIVGGQHYQVYNQLRRKPGVYVTQKSSHDLKTEVHIAGRSFDIEVDHNGIMMVNQGQKTVPLYPLLSRMGVTDATLANALGNDILSANKAYLPKRQDTAAKRLGQALTGETFETADAAAKATSDYLYNAELAPEVTKRTLGQAYSRVTPDVLVKGVQELLKASRGERAPDDRESLEYKKIYSVSDFLKDRFYQADGSLQKGFNEFRNKIQRRLGNMTEPPTQIGRVVSSNEFSPVFEKLFSDTELARGSDQTNPFHMLNGLAKVTITGEGGISSERMIKEEDRSVHPSHLGFMDPIHTPDSENIGSVTTLPIGVAKNKNELQARVWDTKTKAYRYVSPYEAGALTMAFPDQYKDGVPIAGKVKALVHGETKFVSSKDVDIVLPSAKQGFSVSSNSIPFLPSASGVRAQMATKMLEQAIPLTHREAPLVRIGIGRSTLEKQIGEGFSFSAKEDGVVDKVTPTKIVIKTKDGVVEQPIYNNMPLNGKAFLHAEPRVKVGDQVKKGQVLADSNFTADGNLAVGTNLRTAYIPYKGYNFEDGIVITESAAAKLTSEHMYQYAQDLGDTTTLSATKYRAWKGNDPIDASKLEDGLVRKGQILKKGDPLWAGVRETRVDPDSIMIHKVLGKVRPVVPFKETWDNDADGEVTDVVRQGGKVKVYVKALEPAQIGDKLTGRHGNKGIITKIIPDGQAPMTKDGQPVDILLNPHGIVTRMNPSQILETAAAKVAEKTGKPYIVDNFSGENYAKKVKADLDKHGISDTEELIDPTTNKSLGQVLVGSQYILKLSKQATTQFSARAEGKYDINKNPLKGGDDGSKAVDVLTMYSMLAHGARANLREMATYKASQNPQFWTWLQAGPALGLVTPAPTPTFAYQKFEAYMRAAGVNIERNGSKFLLRPMFDKDVKKLSSGEVTKPLFLQAKDLKQEKGGFFDPVIFGPGKPSEQEKWGHIELAEPMPNPIFEDPIKKLTGLKDAQFKGLVGGKLYFDAKEGGLNTEGKGATGGEAVREMLSKVNVDEQIQSWTTLAKAATEPKKLDEANKRLKYLFALKKLGVRPEEAYIQTKLAVLPPQFRPTSEMQDGSLSVAGMNNLYRDVGLINQELKWQKTQAFIPDELRGELRENLYAGARALYGLQDPIAFYPKERRPKGIVQQLSGKPGPAKSGFFQKEVLRRTQNLVGRGTIIPEPKLGLDEVGLPEEMAWNIFKPFAIRMMVGLGKNPNDALTEYEQRTPGARSALMAAMSERPVLLNRAPSLHKFSVMAFNPRITDGHAVKIPPLVVKGFNADFDGDAMTVHVPILPDAVEEARRMMPSKNLYSHGTGDVVIMPQNEAALGLWKLSQTPEGQKAITDALPEDLRAAYGNKLLGKGGLRTMMDSIAKAHPNDFGKTVDKLKQLGDDYTYKTGFTVSMKDLMPVLPEREKIVHKLFEDLVKNTGMQHETPANKQKAIDLIKAADAELQGVLKKDLGAQGNRFFEMVDSGARGNMNQLKQVLSGPMLVSDHHGGDMSIPVTSSFAEGLPFSEYWNTLYGARAVATDKQLQTQKPGAFNKDILAATNANVISMADCKTTHGIDLKLDTQARDIEDRYLAKDISVHGHQVAKAGDLVTSNLLNVLRDRKVTDVSVRSPLTCRASKGTCAKCYGVHEDGKAPPIGENIGTIAGQSLSEPLTQMTLRTFHTGGVAGSRGAVSGYEKIDKLLKMPKLKNGKATLSDVSGKVEKITPSTGGLGFDVMIDGKDGKGKDVSVDHFVAKDLFDSKAIRVGTVVKRGDAISDGIIQPQELVARKGMLAAQNYVVDEIQKAYQNEKVPVKRRMVETILRTLGSTTKVTSSGSSAFIPGDMAPFGVVEDFNHEVVGKKPLREAIGYVLKDDVGGVKSGTVIDDQVFQTLKKLGKSHVEVGNVPIEHTPFITGIGKIPFLRNDWMSQMGYQRIKDAMITGATQGRETDIHGYAPVPAFTYGAELGKAPGGKSKTEGVY